MAAFTFNDALLKLVGDSMNMGQAMLLRGIVTTVLVGTLGWMNGALRLPRQALHPVVLMRVVADSLTTAFYLIALQNMAFSNTVAIYQALPLAVTVGAMVFFGEYVGWRRWLAIGFGFLGVLVIVQPGTDAFNPSTILVICAVAAAAARDMLMRKVPATIPTTLVSLVTSCSATIFGALLVQPLGGWSTPSAGDLTVLAIAALAVAAGYQFFIIAGRIGEMSFVAPFRYTSLLWGVVLGFAMFGERPDAVMLTGASMILASGLYMLYRERVVRKARNAALSAAKSPPPGLA